MAAYVLASVALICILWLHLLAALLAGLLVHQLIHIVARKLNFVGVKLSTGKVAALTIISSGTVLALALATLGLTGLLSSQSASLLELLQKMADEIDTLRTHFPVWVQDLLPTDAEQLQSAAAGWLRDHAGELQRAGASFGGTVLKILIGMIIGAMIALNDPIPGRRVGPLAHAIAQRASSLGNSFRRVVFAQVRISAINSLLTALYLLGVLPMLGINLPLTKTMIAVTFFAGLLPVVGNLISNTVIVVVSLSVSLYAAVASLFFLLVIHKLEYFLNARIIGSRIHAHAWELLLTMLVMEAAFGVTGLIAAPIYYAYLKDELLHRNLI